MTIEDIKRFAEQELEDFGMMTLEEQHEYDVNYVELAQLRMRQLWLVADIAQSLKGLNLISSGTFLAKFATRLRALEEKTEGFEKALEILDLLAREAGLNV